MLIEYSKYYNLHVIKNYVYYIYFHLQNMILTCFHVLNIKYIILIYICNLKILQMHHYGSDRLIIASRHGPIPN